MTGKAADDVGSTWLAVPNKATRSVRSIERTRKRVISKEPAGTERLHKT